MTLALVRPDTSKLRPSNQGLRSTHQMVKRWAGWTCTHLSCRFITDDNAEMLAHVVHKQFRADE